MLYLIKFLKDVLKCKGTELAFIEDVLSNMRTTIYNGEFAYIYELTPDKRRALFKSGLWAKAILNKFETLGLILPINIPKNNPKARLYYVTPLYHLPLILATLSTHKLSKKQRAIAYSIYNKFILNIHSGKQVYQALISAINQHKNALSKTPLPINIKKLIGHYRAYKFYKS